jgi:cytochrome c
MRAVLLPPVLLPVLLLALPLVLAGCSRNGGPVDGATVFKPCASCHQVGPNARGGFGPQLNGLFGRRAGSTTDFAYSDAMKTSDIVWDERTLAAYLRDPDKIVPGTKMRFWGIRDENDMAALLAYLRTFQHAH